VESLTVSAFEQPAHWDDAALQYERTAHRFTSLYAEDAAAMVPLGPRSTVLDVAAGTGALAFVAARKGARVLATDFAPGMVARIAAAAVPGVEARVMDGQALDLPDAHYDAVFSLFGVIMFADWRKGLAEMARVTRPGGHGVVGTWADRGAATFLLLGEVRRKLFPGRAEMAMPPAIAALSTPEGFVRELRAAGYRSAEVRRVTHDFALETAALDQPDTLFGMSPDWKDLSAAEQAAVIAEVRRMAAGRPVLPVPSTALIGLARR